MNPIESDNIDIANNLYSITQTPTEHEPFVTWGLFPDSARHHFRISDSRYYHYADYQLPNGLPGNQYTIYCPIWSQFDNILALLLRESMSLHDFFIYTKRNSTTGKVFVLGVIWFQKGLNFRQKLHQMRLIHKLKHLYTCKLYQRNFVRTNWEI